MGKQTFTLISLKDKESQKLTEVLSNPTCRKILDYLADKKDATETEISKNLKIAISTTHYNLKLLLGTKLIKADEYHYSKRGKEINHYSVANKYIIITPQKTRGLATRLKKALPPFIIAFAAVSLIGLIRLFSNIKNTEKIATSAGEISILSGSLIAPTRTIPSSVLWTLCGIFFAFIVYVVYEFIRTRIKK